MVKVAITAINDAGWSHANELNDLHDGNSTLVCQNPSFIIFVKFNQNLTVNFTCQNCNGNFIIKIDVIL